MSKFLLLCAILQYVPIVLCAVIATPEINENTDTVKSLRPFYEPGTEQSLFPRKYNESNMSLVIRKLTNLQGVEVNEAQTAAESLEFMLGYVKKSIEIETKLDNILTRMDEERNKKQLLLDTKNAIIENINTILVDVDAALRNFIGGHITNLVMMSTLVEIMARKNKFEVSLPPIQNESLDDINMVLVQDRLALLAEYNSMNDMYLLPLAWHLHSVQYSAGLYATNQEDTPLPLLEGNVDFNLNAIESLLKSYQSLAVLKTSLGLEDQNNEAETVGQIQALEGKISVDQEQFRQELRKLLPYVARIGIRMKAKIGSVDLMMTKLTQIMKASAEGLVIFAKLDRVYKQVMEGTLISLLS